MGVPTQFVFNNNTYAGEELAGYISTSLLPPDGSVERGLLSVKDNVKKRLVIRKMETEVEFQDPSAKFNAQASPDNEGDERYLDPVKYEVMKETSYEELINSWESKSLKKGSLHDNEGVVDLENFLRDRELAKIAIMNERLYWRGKAAAAYGGSTVTFAAAYPGLLPRMQADASVLRRKPVGELTLTGITTANPGVVTVASTATLRTGDWVTLIDVDGNQQVGGVSINGQSFQITVINNTTFSLGKQVTGAGLATDGKVQFINASNVIEILTQVYNEVPEEVRDQEDFKVIVSNHIKRAYAQAQAEVANGAGKYFVGQKEMDFLGELQLEGMKHFFPNNILCARSSNLWLAVDVLSDESTLKTMWMGDKTMDDVTRMKCSMKSDTNYGFPEEIYYMFPRS